MSSNPLPRALLASIGLVRRRSDGWLVVAPASRHLPPNGTAYELLPLKKWRGSTLPPSALMRILAELQASKPKMLRCWRMRYGALGRVDGSYSDIGRAVGVSRSRAQQLTEAAIKRIVAGIVSACSGPEPLPDWQWERRRRVGAVVLVDVPAVGADTQMTNGVMLARLEPGASIADRILTEREWGTWYTARAANDLVMIEAMLAILSRADRWAAIAALALDGQPDGFTMADVSDVITAACDERQVATKGGADAKKAGALAERLHGIAARLARVRSHDGSS